MGLVSVACGTTTLHPLEAKRAQALLPFLEGRPTRTELVEKFARPPLYDSDASGRILVYRMAVEKAGALVVRAGNDPHASHELVLVFDEHGRLKRYALIRVR